MDCLRNAFGFHRRAAHAHGDAARHAQLACSEGGTLIIESVDEDGSRGQRFVQAGGIGRRQTQGCCVVIADAGAHYARAKDDGAVIGMGVQIAIADQDQVSRGSAWRKIKRRPWWFGSYQTRAA